tara:strand:- start:1399 stop:1710 length:312 start_codon:yes stop_codon:yes gene_type:complete
LVALPWFLCEIIGRNFLLDNKGRLEEFGFENSMTVEADDKESAKNSVKMICERKFKQWEHPKQIDQGYCPSIEVFVLKENSTTKAPPLGYEVNWIKSSEMNNE